MSQIIEDEENGPDQSIVSEYSDNISSKSIIPDSFEDTQSIVKKYLSLSVPAVLGFFLIQVQDQISVYFVAQLNQTTDLAGIGFGNMMIIILPYSVMIGINTALETFVSRAAGRQNLADCGLYLHRAIFVITLIFIPVSIILYFTYAILMLIGVEEGSAMVAQQYVRMMLPGVLLNSFADSIDLFLIPLGYSIPICLLQLAVVPFHIFFCWLFVDRLQRGVVGAAIAHNITASLTILFLCSYVSCQKEIKDAWYLPTKRTFHNLKEFLELAIPGVLMLLLENSNMQIMLLLAGTFGNDDLAAAQTLVVAFGDFIMMIPYGLSLGVVTLVGNSLGSNHPGASKTRFRIATVFSSCLAAVVCTLLIFLRTYIVSMYTKNQQVIDYAQTAFLAFSIAFFFDWIQCILSGSIKAVGAQAVASISSLCCMLFVSLPISYMLGVKQQTLWGLWTGYGTSAFTLACVYLTILCRTNWKEIAIQAAKNETKLE